MPTLNWIGKEKVINHHQDVPFRVLEHKYGFTPEGQSDAENKSGNKIIHGDNLEALKSLLPEYEGKIKCIYIDPPYNTGNENWVYNDNVNHPKIKKWLGQVVGKEEEDLSRHDKWLCMMYPRLKLLHKLLADDGAIFISIDDNEQANLKLIMDEIFGGRNYIGNIIWRKKEGGGQTDKYYVTEHEYICVYQKTGSFIWKDKKRQATGKDFNRNDSNGSFKIIKLEKWGSGARRIDRPTMHFSIIAPDNSEFYPVAPDGTEGRWRVGKKRMLDIINNNLIHWEFKNNKYIPYEKVYFEETKTTNIKERSILYNLTNTTDASKILTEIFGEKDIFDTPKPIQLLSFFINHSTDKNSIILDSFAGSGTTAHAVLNLNKEDGGERKFILIEMEDYAESITSERVKRVINGYGNDNKQVEGTGGSFDYYELGPNLFDENENLNEEIPENKIREYIYYTETRQPLKRQIDISNKYYLDSHNDTAYYFYYEKDRITTLNYETLKIISEKAEQYIVYADICLIDDDFLSKRNIIFKKIPRDIKRF